MGVWLKRTNHPAAVPVCVAVAVVFSSPTQLSCEVRFHAQLSREFILQSEFILQFPSTWVQSSAVRPGTGQPRRCLGRKLYIPCDVRLISYTGLVDQQHIVSFLSVPCLACLCNLLTQVQLRQVQ